MARVFDHIDQELLSALWATLSVSKRADFCVGHLICDIKYRLGSTLDAGGGDD